MINRKSKNKVIISKIKLKLTLKTLENINFINNKKIEKTENKNSKKMKIKT